MHPPCLRVRHASRPHAPPRAAPRAQASLGAILLVALAAVSSTACGSVIVEADPGAATSGGTDDPPSIPPPTTRAGMTWSVLDHDDALGVDHVGCGEVCDAYHGDTACSEQRPILCVRLDGALNPGVEEDFYHGWIGGPIALTPPVSGLDLGARADADALCAMHAGPGFVMAEFHHPSGGWSYWAFGALADDTRFWVAIDDQPANCWD